MLLALTHLVTQVLCPDPGPEEAGEDLGKKLVIDVTSPKHSGVRNKLEKQDGGNKFFLNNLSSNTKYTVALRRQSGDSLRSD